MTTRTEKHAGPELLRACGCLAILLALSLCGCGRGLGVGNRLRSDSPFKKMSQRSSPLPKPPATVEPRRPRLLRHAGRPLVPPPPDRQPPMPTESTDPVPATQLDFWSAMELGGANSLLIELSRQQVELAEQHSIEAQALWYPSLRMGLGYSRHDGQLQNAIGDVIQAGRNSFFLGGGAGLGSAALPGGTAGPPRMTVNLSLADARFEPVIAERLLEASRAGQSSVMNDVLLEIAIAYIDVLEARGRLVHSQQSYQDTTHLLELARIFAREGKGSEAEVNRAQVERAGMQIALENNQRQITVRTAWLAQKLHLPPDTDLLPEEEQLRPMQVIEDQQGLKVLVSHGLAQRPELARQHSLLEAAEGELTREQWRPWLPNVQVGASGGTFGGGGSGNLENQGGRGDLEVLAVWEWRNLGVVDYTRQAQQKTRIRQQQTHKAILRDQVATEVTVALAQVESYRRQMATALASLQAADDSYRRNRQRVREAEGMPLELIQAIRARLEAQNNYTGSIAGFNRAQFRLLRAVGQPPVSGGTEKPTE